MMFFNNTISDDVKQLIRSMIQNDPNERLSAEQCLQEPWFILKSHSRNLLENSKEGLIRRSTFKKNDNSNPESIKLGTLLNKEIIRSGIDTFDQMRKTHSVCLDPDMLKHLLDHNGGIRNVNPVKERADSEDIRMVNLTSPPNIAPINKTYTD
jgi:serine/threonine protein kinase